MTTMAVSPTRTWQALGVSVQLVVTDPGALSEAHTMLVAELDALDLACSRFRPDSEVLALSAFDGAPMPASPLLRDAVRVALAAADWSDGDLDPTLGSTMVTLGYDRDFASLSDRGDGSPVRVHRAACWRDVVVDEETVTVPAGVLLDLGATAKAFGADRAAGRIARALGCGVLVSLGGDVAVAGDPPIGGWTVRVQDRPGAVGEIPVGPHQTVALYDGGLATSSTTARRWLHRGQTLHHILDPRTLTPAVSPWRTITAVAPTCVAANTLTTAAIIRGESALGWLRALGVPARLVTHAGGVFTVNGWPEPGPEA